MAVAVKNVPKSVLTSVKFTQLCAMTALYHSTLKTRYFYYPSFTAKETEAQRG